VDGIAWTQETTGLPWRYDAGVVVFQGRLWLLGGSGGGQWNDVWSSPDGVNWVQETAAAGWSPRSRHSASVFNGKMWVLGGYFNPFNPPGPYIVYNDVWSSTDGVNWTQEVAAAAWSARSEHSTVVFDNRLWVVGGSVDNDVWSSTDGISWTLETPVAPWPLRFLHGTEVFNNRIWMFGGTGVGDPIYNDVWSSTDGVNWTEETPAAPWTPRAYPRSAVFGGRIWMMGGADGQGRNDVWSYGLHITPAKLGSGIIEVPYSKNLEAREGVGPYVWSMVGGSLPPGLTVDTSSTTATVNVSGVPTETGKWTFTMRVEDQSSGDWAEQEITLKINAQSSRADRTDDNGCATHPAPQLPAAILTAATATAALLRRRRVLG
jgi:hypothetical protein